MPLAARVRKMWIPLCAVAWALSLAVHAEDAAPASPLSPADALAGFQLAEGLTIELAACEPEVVDPVEVRFDENGRMWVVEMRDYPNGPAEGSAPLSRIRVLDDRDGDGRFETATTFAEGLLFPTGLQPWRGGAFVTLAGRVAYMKDTDGDGRCDLDETWYAGFAEQNPQLRANHPRLALDGWIYVANGLRGGAVTNARVAGAEPLDISGRDFRFDPHTGECEAVSGAGQFGLTFDDYGNRFVCSNRNPLRHIVLEERYLRRNPLVAVAAVAHDVAAAETASKVFPISRAWTTSNLHAGQFTAACGVTIYRGDALPDDYYGNAFICEPTGNLVQCQILEPAGATFRSRPRFADREFLASADEWFRPVNLDVGPDGGLYVVDMYRAVIEHPEWVPDELKHRPDERYGDDRGRIWRIVRAGFQRSPAGERTAILNEASTNDLAARLNDANAWQRETAIRLLHERQDTAAAAELKRIAAEGGAPAARVAALRTLSVLRLLDEVTLRKAWADPHPRVREQALALTEELSEAHGFLVDATPAALEDADARVRFQWALACSSPHESSVPSGMLASSALAATDDWTRRAVQIAAGEDAGGLFVEVLRRLRASESTRTAGHLALVRELAATAAAQGDDAPRRAALDAIASIAAGDERLQAAALLGFASAWQGGESFLSAPALDELYRWAARQAGNASVEESLRAEAVDLLALAPYSFAGEPLTALIRGEPSQALRIRASAALARQQDPSVASILLSDFSAQTPVLRAAVLDAVIDGGPRATALLEEIAAGRIAAQEIDLPRAERLLGHPNAGVAARARVLFAATLPADRQQVLAEYQSALQLDGDALRGQAVFAKNCAACHRVGEVGVNVAPDISDSRTKTHAQLLGDILQPNRAIDANYVSYAVVTTDGLPLAGVIAAETATSVTLRMAENKTVTLLRSDIEELRSTGRSLMPDGLEKEIPPPAMADLLSFIKNWRYLDGAVPAGR